jgi:hypothetical protein
MSQRPCPDFFLVELEFDGRLANLVLDNPDTNN